MANPSECLNQNFLFDYLLAKGLVQLLPSKGWHRCTIFKYFIIFLQYVVYEFRSIYRIVMVGQTEWSGSKSWRNDCSKWLHVVLATDAAFQKDHSTIQWTSFERSPETSHRNTGIPIILVPLHNLSSMTTK